MTRLHFADLTAITAPFGLLDDDTQQRLRAWPHGWELVGAFGRWGECEEPSFFADSTYRARPAPLVQDIVDWSHVAEPYNWHARDEDGDGCFYEKEPNQGGDVWLTNGGQYCRSAAHASYARGNTKWQDSKISRDGVKG